MDERVGKGLSPQNSGVKSKQTEDKPLEKTKDAYSEIADIFPALQKYKDEHNTANLQKLMVEILEFCRSELWALCGEPEEGWIPFAYKFATHLLYPDPEFSKRASRYASGAMFYLHVLQFFFDEERKTKLLDALKDLAYKHGLKSME